MKCNLKVSGLMLEYNTPKAPAVVTMGDFHFRHTQMTVTPHPYINPK